MNRRRFLEIFSAGAIGSGIVYSFPKIIIPKNIIRSSNSSIFRVSDDPNFGFGFSGFKSHIIESTSLGNDWWYREFHKDIGHRIDDEFYVSTVNRTDSAFYR